MLSVAIVTVIIGINPNHVGIIHDSLLDLDALWETRDTCAVTVTAVALPLPLPDRARTKERIPTQKELSLSGTVPMILHLLSFEHQVYDNVSCYLKPCLVRSTSTYYSNLVRD